MSFTKIARENRAKAEREAQRAREAQLVNRYFMSAIKFSEPQGEMDLIDAVYRTPIITAVGDEVLAITPQAVMSRQVYQ